ncbi:hypothetical protein [Marisediminitalea sp.]|uniref:hypothetical protein n=1 Tax=Marisediminitalea sp. TaxID=2662268 RepID=UPI0035167CCF
MNLANLKTKDSISVDQDRVGGRRILDTDVYGLTIELAYLTLSAKNAYALNIQAKTEDGATVNQQFWMTSNEDKGCKNTYVDNNGDEQYLPGFQMANTLALLTAGCEIAEVETAEKTINLYNPELKKEAPTKVTMFMGMLGKQVKAGIQRQTVDKRVKNEAGQYVPSGETVDVNEIVKFFRYRDDLTVNEILAQAEEAAFIKVWLDQNKGNVINKAKGASANGATKGAPGSTAGAASGAAPKKSLFA